MAPNIPPANPPFGGFDPKAFSSSTGDANAAAINEAIKGMVAQLDKFKLAGLQDTTDALKAKFSDLADMTKVSANTLAGAIGVAEGEIIAPAQVLAQRFAEVNTELAVFGSRLDEEIIALRKSIKEQRDLPNLRGKQRKQLDKQELELKKKVSQKQEMLDRSDSIQRQRRELNQYQNTLRAAREAVTEPAALQHKTWKTISADAVKASKESQLANFKSKNVLTEYLGTKLEQTAAGRGKGAAAANLGLSAVGSLGVWGLVGKAIMDGLAGAVRANTVMAPTMLRSFGGIGAGGAEEGILHLRAGSLALNNFAKETRGLLSQDEMAGFMGVLNSSALFNPTILAKTGQSISSIGPQIGKLSGRLTLLGKALGMTTAESAKFFADMNAAGLVDLGKDFQISSEKAFDTALSNIQKIQVAQGGDLFMANSALQRTVGLTRQFGVGANKATEQLASTLGILSDFAFESKDEAMYNMFKNAEWRAQTVDTLMGIGAGIDAISMAGYNMATGQGGAGGAFGDIYKNLTAGPLDRLTSFMDVVAKFGGGDRGKMATWFTQLTKDPTALKALTEITSNPDRLREFKNLKGAEDLKGYQQEFKLNDDSIDALAKLMIVSDDPMKAVVNLLTNIAQGLARLVTIASLNPFGAKRAGG